MIIKIEVKSPDVAEKSVVSKKDGQRYLIRSQAGWIDLGKFFPQEVRIPIDQGKEPYPVGKYTMDPSCLYVDRYGTLSLSRLRLVPLKA